MAQFIRKIVEFGLFLLLGLLALQLGVGWRIGKATVHGYDNLENTQGNYDLVFLGSSRSFIHFDPGLFDGALHLRSVNLGTNGHSDLAMHILRLENYLARNPSPRWAILEVDPLLLPGSLTDHLQQGHKNSFARYAWLASSINGPIVSYFGFNWAERYVPLYALFRYRILWDCITLSNANNWKVYGYNRHDETWDTLSHPVLPQKMSAISRYFDTSATALKVLRDQLKRLDSLCRSRKIKLICVQTPIYRPLYIESYFSKTGKLCSGVGIPFFDCNGPIDTSLDCFFNAEHLNTKGVKRMTAELFSNPDFYRQFR